MTFSCRAGAARAGGCRGPPSRDTRAATARALKLTPETEPARLSGGGKKWVRVLGGPGGPWVLERPCGSRWVPAGTCPAEQPGAAFIHPGPPHSPLGGLRFPSGGPWALSHRHSVCVLPAWGQPDPSPLRAAETGHVRDNPSSRGMGGWGLTGVGAPPISIQHPSQEEKEGAGLSGGGEGVGPQSTARWGAGRGEGAGGGFSCAPHAQGVRQDLGVGCQEGVGVLGGGSPSWFPSWEGCGAVALPGGSNHWWGAGRGMGGPQTVPQQPGGVMARGSGGPGGD